MSRPNQPTHPSLTDREQQILRLLATGGTDREIAEVLVLTVGTVKWYNRQIYSKLGVRNRVEAVAQAQEQALPGNVTVRLAHTSASKKMHNLPAQTTAFVGREAELSELARLLNDPQLRLVTIVASGGMGKTRVALEAAEQQIENFANGVYLVELAPLSDPNNIVSAIADATDYQFQPGEREPKQQILDFLANNTMLLVMDNYEHLLERASLMTDILNVAPNVQILATSRQRLNQPGEIVFNLAGLDSPEWGTPESALKYASVKLFIQSAKRVQLQFDVTPDNVDEVVRICMLVQGMPLGILIAASWIAMLSAEEIAKEIAQGIDFLENDMSGLPERHRSIRTVFDTSWEMMNEDERGAFMKLSVFRGGFTREAARAVAGANLRTLMNLMNKALISRNADSGRYMIHELLRQYGEEQLEEADWIETTRDAHMRYYADFMHKREAELKGRRQLEAMDEIEADFENVRAAWRWALQQQHYETFDQMAFALTLFAVIGSRAQEGGELFAETVRQLTDKPDTIHRWLVAKVQSCYGGILMDLGRFKQAEPIIQESLAILREYSDQAALTYCLRWLSRVKVYSGQPVEGRQAAEEQLLLSSEAGDTWEMAFAHYYISTASGMLGDLKADYSHRLQSLSLFSKAGDTFGKAWAHSRLGLPSIKPGNSEKMFQHNLQAYQLFRKLGNKFGMAYVLNKQGAAALTNGDFDQAAQLAEESLVIARSINRSDTIASALLTLSEANENNGDYEAAHRLAQEAFLHAQTSNNLDKISNAKLRIGLTLCCLDAYNEAIEYLCSALKVQSELERTSGILSAIAAFIHIVAHRGQNERAAELFGLVFQHPVQMAPLTSYPRLLELRDSLQSDLSQESFNAAYERGNFLDVETVVQQLLDEFLEVG